MTTRRCVLFGTVAACLLTIGTAREAAAGQPYLGFDGTLVQLPKRFDFGNGIKGIRVNSVNRRSPATQMGLERGDIIVLVDNQIFENMDAYRYALRQTGKTARIGLINCRNGQLIYRKCRLNHTPHYGERPPLGYGIVD